MQKAARVLILVFMFASYASATGFSAGDVLVALTNGTVQVRAANGTLKTTLTGPVQGMAKGLALDSAGNLLVSHWYTPDLSGGNAIAKFTSDGNFAGTFGGSYACNPSGIAIDKNGNVFVGQADCNGDILQFDSAGNLTHDFNVTIEQRGARWLDLAADGCTMYYTSIGQFVQRFNVCTNTQMSNFNSSPLTNTDAEAVDLRILPNGGVIVADIYDVRRLDASGNQVAIYDAAGDNGFAGIALDPDGKSFWASSFLTSNVYKFDIATGAILMSFTSGVANVGAKGIAIVPTPNAAEGRMTGGGNFLATNGAKVTHGFQLRCNVNDPRQNLEVNWDRGQKFHLESVTTVRCFDDPAIDPEHPAAPIDTLVLTGTGRYNGQDGATITLTFTDAGEPGRDDGVQMQIKDANGTVVLDVAATTLTDGNHQAHRETGKTF